MHRRYSRPDMPATMQLGLVTYTDWSKANDFDPFVHNSNVLEQAVLDQDIVDPTPGESFNPDLVAGFEYARFARPDVPVELDGVDLVNAATDEQLLSFLGAATPEPGFALIGDQVMNANDEQLIVALAETQPDGAPLNYTVELIDAVAVELDQQHNLYTGGDYYTNWGGRDEKWLQGNNGWYFVLPNGGLWQWNGDFDDSTQVAELTPRYYEDPALLHDAQPRGSASADDATLIVTPVEGFVGILELRLTTSNGTASATELLTVSVVNSAPTLEAIDDQLVSRGQRRTLVPVVAADADGDTVLLTASVVQPRTYQLDQEFEFSTPADYYTNWGGRQEQWIRDAQDAWHYLLPTGELFRWEGTFESSTRIASLESSHYDDPSLLTDAQAVGLTAETADNLLTLRAAARFSGSVRVFVTVSDGVASATRMLTVEVVA